MFRHFTELRSLFRIVSRADEVGSNLQPELDSGCNLRMVGHADLLVHAVGNISCNAEFDRLLRWIWLLGASPLPVLWAGDVVANGAVFGDCGECARVRLLA